MLIQKTRDCPICGSKEKNQVHHQLFSSFSEGSLFEGYWVVSCNDCGFIYADDIPSQEEFDIYYKEMSKYENEYLGGNSSASAIHTYKAIVEASKRFIPDKNARILDIGCATGALLYEFKKVGYSNCIGLDPSPSCARTGLKLYGINILNCAISEIVNYQDPFDFIILNSVLEHIRDVKESILAMSRLLKPGGLIWIEVPDIVRFQYFVPVGFQQFSMEHINYFSPISLTNLMQSLGFVPLATWQNERRLEAIIDPALSAIFEKTDKSSTPGITKDDISLPALLNYLEISNQVDGGVMEKINAIEKSGKPIIVWGVGTHTQRLLASSRLANVEIKAFIDSNVRYQGKTLNGIPIISPEMLGEMKDAILISSRLYQEEIADQIQNQYHLPNEIIRLY
jgi:SAM-dependent methyltransferase